jgi:hypothetical protein
MGLKRQIAGCATLVLLALAPVFPQANALAAPTPVAKSGTDSCRLIAVNTATPIGVGGCSGVRPGAFFSSPIGGCSFNFLFKGSDGHRYIGTAGHCLVADGREQKWSLGKGPVISAGGRTVGRGAYGILKGNRDFGLIRLDRNVKASAQMCHFGGPTGIDTARMTSPVLLEHYGNGVAISSVLPARTSIAMDTRDPDVVSALGVALFGDSGSGTTRGGRALGVLVSIGAGTGSLGNIFITRLAPQIALAQRALGTTLTLQTAPRL